MGLRYLISDLENCNWDKVSRLYVIYSGVLFLACLRIGDCLCILWSGILPQYICDLSKQFFKKLALLMFDFCLVKSISTSSMIKSNLSGVF